MLRYKYRLPVSGAAFAVLIAFIYSLSSTLIMPVFPLFLKSLVNKSAYVGYFMSFIYFLVLIYILISTYFLKNNKIFSFWFWNYNFFVNNNKFSYTTNNLRNIQDFIYCSKFCSHGLIN